MIDGIVMHRLRLYLEHSVLHLLQGLFHLFYLFFCHNQLCDFKGDSAEADHIPYLKWRAHLLQILEHEPTVLLNYDLGVPLVHFVGERLTDEVIVAMVHNIEQLATFSLQILLSPPLS